MTGVKYIKPRVWEEVVDLIYRMADIAKSESNTIKCKAGGVMLVVKPESNPCEGLSNWYWVRYQFSLSK